MSGKEFYIDSGVCSLGYFEKNVTWKTSVDTRVSSFNCKRSLALCWRGWCPPPRQICLGSACLRSLLTWKALEGMASAFSLQTLAPCTDSWHSDTSLLRSKQISMVKAFSAACLLSRFSARSPRISQLAHLPSPLWPPWMLLHPLSRDKRGSSWLLPFFLWF